MPEKKETPTKENYISEKLDTIKSEKSVSMERKVEEPVNYPPCSTKVICSPEFQEDFTDRYMKETSEFGKIITDSSMNEH